MRKQLALLLLLTVFLFPAAAQENIQTAQDFFDELANRYSQIEDYTAEITTERTDTTMRGTLFYKRPNRVRINFTQPEDQVLVSDGERLQVYIPEYNVVLQQSLRQRTQESMGNLATAEGLALMRNNYSIAYLDSPEPVPLEEGSEVMVTKLRLNWQSNTEGFRQLTLSVTDDFLIRRIVGVSLNYEEVEFNFTDVQLNQNIPAARFNYEAPASANVYSDFLFGGQAGGQGS
jgi:outer membrane lipoprotein-sorting protein